MRNAGGYAFCFDVGGVHAEVDTFTCFHCSRVVFVKPKCDPCDLGGLCRVCDKMICPACVDLGRCDPLEKKLEREEAKYQALRSYGF